ncbi:MAG TPA: hypothetical protein VKZ74_07530 [Natronosporangium sp.]|nr:hypothetical protein [Natronosporangium sp.]
MRPPRSARVTWVVPALALTALLAGCGPPPEYPAPGSPSSRPAAPALIPTPATTAAPPTGLPGPATSPSGFPEDRAVRCGGRLDGDQVLALLEREGLLGRDLDARVDEGPLCARDWQYTVVTVPERDPLRVVTRGEPGDLALVTAGTEVCTVEVRVQAPSGIRAAADCVS